MKVVTKELLYLINLAKTQNFQMHKFISIFVIHKDKNLIFIAFYIILLYFKKFNNNQKLVIISFIPSFNQNHFF